MIEGAAAQTPEERLRSAIRYSVTAEGVQNLGDFLIRRTGMLYFERDRIAKTMDVVVDELRRVLGEEAVKSAEFEREYEAVVAFRKAPETVS